VCVCLRVRVGLINSNEQLKAEVVWYRLENEKVCVCACACVCLRVHVGLFGMVLWFICLYAICKIRSIMPAGEQNSV